MSCQTYFAFGKKDEFHAYKNETFAVSAMIDKGVTTAVLFAVPDRMHKTYRLQHHGAGTNSHSALLLQLAGSRILWKHDNLVMTPSLCNSRNQRTAAGPITARRRCYTFALVAQGCGSCEPITSFRCRHPTLHDDNHLHQR